VFQAVSGKTPTSRPFGGSLHRDTSWAPDARPPANRLSAIVPAASRRAPPSSLPARGTSSCSRYRWPVPRLPSPDPPACDIAQSSASACRPESGNVSFWHPFSDDNKLPRGPEPLLTEIFGGVCAQRHPARSETIFHKRTHQPRAPCVGAKILRRTMGVSILYDASAHSG
jgi:hypothetical protein